ncbi:hypothetical protein Bca52824_095164 [Brassica carinata]|uniref:Riboflavin biosynthesis protein PYRD, chloroplastic n=1 Tax=Brassica carinata TaxID=52824 RepID=A0A8X7P0V4_BRACI|nr:hypothetical protein Bca52824_095164 [Brassica carinata]
MRKCVELVQRAMWCTSPNPMVGCVTVKDGKIVGQGFHPKAGQPHAEVFALRDAGELAENVTAYVSLEPCNHYGRTPPCTEALINVKVKRVVVGMVDPNPIVSSSSISHLKDAGIDVIVDVSMKAFSLLQVVYICQWLSDQFSSISSQEETDVSIQPIQIIVASNAHQSPILASSNTDPKVILFTKKELDAYSETSYGGVEIVVLEDINLDSILDYCYDRGLCSVLLDLRGDIKDLEVLFRDGFEQRLLQKIVVEVLPEWCARDER